MPVKEVRRSATAEARRSQIIEATMAVIAAEGFAQATFARITERAGLSSSRLISYHFTDKDDLVLAVVQHVIRDIGEVVGARVSAERTAAGRLRAYIEGVVSFTDEHRAEMTALLQIVLAGALPADSAADQATPSHVEAILRQGQADGEFRDFDAAVVATVIQRSVESLPFALQADPGLDCAGFGRELVTLFDLATRRCP